jgi:thymidylate kinase
LKYQERRLELFISIEGIDCSGKSTISRLLVKKTDSVLYKTPPKGFILERDEVDAKASPIDHYRFYLNGIHAASKEIWEILASGKNVICDRYWLTTYVYHTVMGVSVNVDDFSNITHPDLTVVLLVSKDIQTKRFLERGMSIGDKRMINLQSNLAREYKRALSKFKIPQLIINTDYDFPAEVAEKIQAHIDAYI